MQQILKGNCLNNQLQISIICGNSPGSGIFFIHSRYTNNEFGTGKIAEVLLFDRLLTETELNQGEAYLANKWVLSEILGSDGVGTVDPFDGAPLTQVRKPTLPLLRAPSVMTA